MKKVKPAPPAKAVPVKATKADMLRTLKFLRKNLKEAQLYHGPGYDKWARANKSVTTTNNKSLIGVLKQVPAEEFKQMSIGHVSAVSSSNYYSDLRGIAKAHGWVELAGPESPRVTRDNLVTEIDAMIAGIMLDGVFDHDMSVLIKRINALMGG